LRRAGPKETVSHSESMEKEDLRDAQREGIKSGTRAIRSRVGGIAGVFLKCVLIPAIIVLVIYSPRYKEGPILSFDEGNYLGSVEAVLDGKTLYSEAYTFYGPILIRGVALCMKLFGVTIATYRATFLAGNIAVLLLSYVLLLFAVRRSAFAFLGGWMIAFVSEATPWYARYGGVRFCGPLLGVLCFCAYFRDRKRAWLVCLAGFLSALFIAVAPDMLYLAIVTGAVGLTIAAVRNGRLQLSHLLRTTLLYGAGFAVPLVVLVVWLVMKGALIPYLQTSFYDVPFLVAKHYPMGGVFQLPPASLSLLAWRTFALTRACLVYVMLAGYGCAICYFVARWRRHHELDVRDSCLAMAMAVGIPLFHTAFTRLEGIQLFWAVPPAVIVLTGLWERLYEWMRSCARRLITQPETRSRRAAALLAVALLALTGSLLWVTQYTVRKRKAVTLLQNYRVAPLPPRLRCVPLDLDRAGILVPENQSKQIKSVVEYITAHTKPGEPVFLLPHEGVLHFLSDRPPPTRFSTAMFTEFRPAYVSEALEDLEKNPPRLAVYVDDKSVEKYIDVPLEERIGPLLDYVRTHYTEVDAIGDTHFYLRNDGADG